MRGQEHTSGRDPIKSVTYLALVANLGLFTVKAVVGLVSGSVALVADGVHSLSDSATDLVVLLGHHLGSKAPDEHHPYGHGRLETFAAGLIGIVLVAVGAAMIYYAALGIARGDETHMGFAILAVAGVSILVKEGMYRLTKAVSLRTHSAALYANAWHQRSDALSSLAVVIGFVAWRLGFGFADQVAAIVVGVMIIFVGVRVLGECLNELSESAVDHETMDHIKRVVGADEAVRQWHGLRSRSVGREIFLDLHILVDPELTVTAAHDISDKLEATLYEQLSRPVNITVHIEPDLPGLRH